MAGTLLTAADWPIIGEIAWLLGKVMSFIYAVLGSILPSDAGLVGLSIILYTIFVYTLLLPLTIKQQRSTKMMAVINPEVQAIQKKYKNKRDQASMMKQNEEIQQVYDKYGTSMSAGCLPMIIQLPLLFALYPVIWDIERFVPAIKTAPEEVQRFLTIPNLSISPMQMFTERADLASQYGVSATVLLITAIGLPALSVLTQYISMRLSQAASSQTMDKNNPMAGTMKSMNVIMPLMSLWIVITLPSGLGIYWVVSAVVRSVQQIFVNRHLKKLSIDELIEKNREKAEKKRAKRGEKAEKINAMAQRNTRGIQTSAKTSVLTDAEKEAKLKKAEESKKNAKAGSLASKANMVKRFNEND